MSSDDVFVVRVFVGKFDWIVYEGVVDWVEEFVGNVVEIGFFFFVFGGVCVGVGGEFFECGDASFGAEL